MRIALRFNCSLTEIIYKETRIFTRHRITNNKESLKVKKMKRKTKITEEIMEDIKTSHQVKSVNFDVLFIGYQMS